MSRAGYSEDIDNNWQLIIWRGAVASAIRGKRGQAFLRELRDALDALPEKRLISGELVEASGEVCALGAIGRKRGLEMASLDPYDHDSIADTLGIAGALAREIEYENDEAVCYNETPEQRFSRMRRWVDAQIKSTAPDGAAE